MSTDFTFTKVHHKICPACKSGQISKVLSTKDYTVSGNSFDIWTCSNCSLRFTQDIPDENTIGQFYQSENYISHSGTKQGIVNRLYHVVRNFTLGQKRRWIEKYTGLRSGKLLDIGCGTGEFANFMSKAGWQVQGLEPDPGARTFAIENYGLSVEASEELFNLKEEDFNIISMWHVLEHVHQLDAYLQQIYKLLTASGTLAIAVPNYTSSDAKTYHAEWAAYDVPRHLYHFSPNSMEALLKQHNFELQKMIALPFDPFYVSLLSEKYRHGKTRLIAGGFKGLSSYLNHVGKPANGSSVLYLAQKG